MVSLAEFRQGTPIPRPAGTHQVTERTAPGRFLRTVWRTHFYAAIFATPILVLMAITGLIIMYTEPVTGLLHPGATRVAAHGQPALGLATQQATAAAAAPPGATLFRVVTPKEPDRVTEFFYSTGPAGVPYYKLADSQVTYVNVNPYAGTVTATGHPGDDLVSLANRMHTSLNNQSLTVPLPSLAHLIAPGDNPKAIQQIPVGDLIIEISMGWALILALSGLYLWWPRRSQKGKTLLAPRIRAKGRLKWRDLHAASGILALGMLLVFITTGMPWSAYWGNTLSAVNTTLTPGPSVDTPSTLAKAGDLDRFGKRIPWATQEDRVPASSTTAVDAGRPAKFSLTDVARAAQQEGMQPGYDIVLPIDEKNAQGQTIYGSYQLANPWPGRINTDKTIYLDQFSGKKLLQSDSSSSGAIGQATSFGVYTHMGTEFGVIDRITMTTGALLLLVSIGTSLVMWWIRRPQGRTGLPKRPANPRLPRTLALVGLAVALIYPLWGVSALVVIMLDWFVIRRVGRLRSAFGMPTPTIPA
ncbi:MAG: PepSY-associated TM helix domain-containing protein [Pseudonocardiaceae bacterium]